ncbi:MAG TPA: penicillin-binding protein 2, partial [Caulobacteraceae bacterium]
LSKTRLERALTGKRRMHLIGGLTPQQRARVHALGLAGISFEPEERRDYPLGATAAHLIGFSDRGGIGVAGAEYALNDALRADEGAGGPVALSVDLRVQAALEDEVEKAAIAHGAKGAVGVVTDVQTGEILALTSYPDFDPNAPGKAAPEQLLNRAAASVFEMGSTFKGFTIAIGLESGAVSRASTFDATTPFRMAGRTVRDFHATNRVLGLDEVFTKSSNIGTSRIALAVGPDYFSKSLRAWGLFEAAPVELAESARPILPSKWNQNTLASASFGHAISVSPLALTAAIQPIVNGGKYVPLTIRKRAPGEKVETRRVLSESTSRQMLELMRLNVTDGSGRSANIPGLRVGGKTGTGEKVVNGRYDATKNVASFAAVFPTDGPVTTKRYFVLVLMDEPYIGGRTGGATAAPAAGKVINRIAPFVGVARVEEPKPAPLVVASAPGAAAR